MTATRSRSRVVDLDERRRRRDAPVRVHPARWWIIAVCFVVVAAGIVAKLAHVQLASSANLVARGAGDRTVTERVPALRGSVLDRSGVDLAVTVPEASVALSRLALADAGID
ncbi:MAG: hypothetical protein ACKO5A_10880, partial [Actinomycetota bacterium]